MNPDNQDIDGGFSLEEAFSRGLRDVAFDLLKMSYRGVIEEDKFETGWGEEDYTKQIYKHMKSNLHKVDDHLSITFESTVTSERTLSPDFPPNKMGRVDITVERVGRRENIHYWIECKLVEENDHRLLREYIKSGIKRYVSGKYAEEDGHFESMAGYVIEGNIEAVGDELSKKIVYYEENYDGMVNLEENLCLVSDDEDIMKFRSQHQRKDGDSFQLDHFLLDFRKR